MMGTSGKTVLPEVEGKMANEHGDFCGEPKMSVFFQN